MATCPNINLDSWKNLVAARGEDLAYYLWDLYEGEVPQEEYKVDVSFQLEDMPASRASEETLNKVKEVAKKMGVSIQSLVDYMKGNPDVDVKSASGVADLVRGVIAVATGRESVALTEEMVHVATAILEQTNPKIITQMISKIDRFKIYKQTLEAYKNNKNYQLANGKPDIRKIKKEAVDKLIAELIINRSEGSTEFPELMEEEQRSTVQKIWNFIMDVIRGMYNSSNIDIFETAAAKVIAGEVGGTVADIKEGSVFLQKKNTLVDKLYDVIMDKNNRLKLNPKTATDKRHYTFDGKPIAKSVTEKIKEEIGRKMPERTGLDKFQDEQKRDWGSEGHAFIENYITNALIDENGYKRSSPLPVTISSKLDERIQQKLRDFATELISSYPEGTRFLIEKKAVNERVKGMLASTIDFIAIEPVITPDGKEDVKVDVLDWKFTNINKEREEDIPWYKRDEWKPQMGEYSKMLYNYGLKPSQLRKARMIPFQSNYTYNIPGDPKSGLQLSSIEIGKLDTTKETNLYLLPVPLNTESTGNAEIDKLLASLRQQYTKFYKTATSPEEKYLKNIQLNELDKAIRKLHLKLDFLPLASVGKQFLKNAKEAFDSFENMDYSKLSKEELNKKLGDLLEYMNSAEKFSTIDDVFLSAYPKQGLTAEDKEILDQLETIAASTQRMLKTAVSIQKQVVVQIALKEDLTTEDTKMTVLEAEKEVGSFARTFTEASKLPAKIIKLGANLIMNSKSLVNIRANRLINEFGDLLTPLEKEAASRGVSAFDLIGKVENGKLTLIKKISREFWDKLKEAKENKDLAFIKDNIDIEKYNELAKETIEKNIKVLEETIFSTDPEENQRQINYRIEKLRNSLDITRKGFNGYEDYQFAFLMNKALKEEKHYSSEYRQLMGNKAAFKMWEFMTALNERGKQMGYLEDKGMSFFPMIEASLIHKLSQTNDLLTQSKDFFTDMYKMKMEEGIGYGKIDPETGKLKKQIPKMFTNTDRKVSELSKDLNRVGVLYIKALLEYENAKYMENTLLTLHSVEKAKGHIIIDENQNIIFESGVPKIDDRTNKNADILETIIDDAIYGINENLSSIGNLGIKKVAEKIGKGEEDVEQKALSTKKLLNNANKLTQALAVGLKPLVAIPNYFGVNFQAFINARNFYRYREFKKNNAKVTTGIGLSTIDKGLIDLIFPLNDDLTKEKRRELAMNNSFIKWLGTWNFSDVMMSTNAFPEKKLQLANALSFNDNSMVLNGKIVNIRQHLKQEDRKVKYDMSESQRKDLEDSFEDRVSKLKESSSLSKIAKIENDRVVIPGVTDEELAKYRTKVVEYTRYLNGQMSSDNKADYRRDSILKSFMMFKNWIPKQVYIRTSDIQKSAELGDWEYGRARLFVKTWAHLGLLNVFKMRQIISGSEEGLRIMDDILQAKRNEYFQKTGQELEITDEEFYDLMRDELSKMARELGLLLGLMTLIIAAKAAAPDDDDDELAKNRYKWWAKAINKITDEIAFYYNPTSFESITTGSIFPALSLLTQVEKGTNHLIREVYGEATDNEDLVEKAHPTKYFLNVIPGAAQFQTEVLPYIDPELAREMGIRVSAESRRR